MTIPQFSPKPFSFTVKGKAHIAPPGSKDLEKDLIVASGLKPATLAEASKSNQTLYPYPELVKAIQESAGLAGKQVDGAWGPITTAALAVWQSKNRRLKNGRLTDEQADCFLSAEFLGAPEPAPSLPLITTCKAGLYDHACDIGDTRATGGWPVVDDQLEEITSTGTWLAGMVRLVSGRKISNMNRPHYSRGLDSFITLDTGSFGIAHWWVGTAWEQLFKPLAEGLPREMVDVAWGAGGYDILTSQAHFERIVGDRRGHVRYCPPRMDWLLAGWWAVARHPLAVEIQIRSWAAKYVGEALNVAREFSVPLSGPDGGVLLGAIARMCNSGPAIARRCLEKYYKPGPGEGAAMGCLKDIFDIDREAGGYSKKGNGPERWRRCVELCKGKLHPAILSRDWGKVVAGSLKLDAEPKRARGYVRGG